MTPVNRYLTKTHELPLRSSEPSCWHGSRTAMSDDYTRCGTPLVYAGQLELQPDILTELGGQKSPDQDAQPST
ncbi:hypothetical protein X888_2700 [Burkholderia pseudomallei MSHR4377]|nr:hypothetical protein X888_2700 [Burkholderia pseudomallei MSHR4377]KGW50990.1 hypothetical protein Y049_836 [Burkholderia pseudomallei MSHR684]CAJ4589497.1 Uncharacterised protein [Burkholderia pseudomallei]CAJ5860755.1 Uncharacterised protein [Burkholderia pseudomallei]CAK1322391.1 Uncharacterised protein [Burkholderia pseudomallei]